MRRRELSLAQFTHALVMAFFVLVGGHFVEEHVLGAAKAEALLRYGFAALGEIPQTTNPQGKLGRVVGNYSTVAKRHARPFFRLQERPILKIIVLCLWCLAARYMHARGGQATSQRPRRGPTSWSGFCAQSGS